MTDRARLFLSRLWLWLSPRWPELDDDTKQSIADQVRLRSEWIRGHRHE